MVLAQTSSEFIGCLIARTNKIMKKLHYSIFINAPREKVWETMLGAESYKEWTKVFNPTSRFEGDWSQSSKILFMGSDPQTGEEGGMVSKIAESRPPEFISIQHLGILKNGVEDYDSEEVRKWTPAFENYTFNEKDGGTELEIDVDTAEEYAEMFDEMWPKSLNVLKEISER